MRLKELPQLCFGLFAAAALGLAGAAHAQGSVGQWDFESGNLSATAGATITDPIAYHDGAGGPTDMATTFDTTTALGIPDIDGTAAHVMMFPAATSPMGYDMPTPPNANGGGSLLNDYTLIMDLLYPASSSGQVRPIIQTDDGTLTAAADFVIGTGDGVGTEEGPFYGQIQPNTWYRLGFVVIGSSQEIHFYINGAEVGVSSIGDPFDSRFALTPAGASAILNNNDTNAAPGYVNSIQIRDLALNAGQMQALGGPTADGIPLTIPSVPSFISSRSPGLNATGVSPQPVIHVEVNPGDTVITSGSVVLSLDSTTVPATIGSAGSLVTVDYSVPTILNPLSTHTLSLVFQDNKTGFTTNSWMFTVANYQNVTLPSPIYLETFDALSEGALPAGWSVTNNTSTDAAGANLADAHSDTYKDFVVISSNRVATLNFDNARRLALPFIVLNNQVLSSLVSGNLVYGESDVRGGNQVQTLFTGDYDLTGQTNVYLAFHSMYEQNQDDIASVEYSIDQGATWLPAIYYLDDEGGAADVIRTNGVIDVQATLGTARGDQAFGLAYSNFIGAPVSASLIPFIAGRINDDRLDGKRIEVIRLAQADGQAQVRFRIGQAGTASWYFGLDDFGLYSINTPVINTQPQSQVVDAGTSATFSVAAIGEPPLTYQWQHNGSDIPGATSADFTIPNVTAADAGQYQVIVQNASGPTASAVAQLDVNTTPLITLDPLSQVVDPGANVTLSGDARGGQPISYSWLKDGSASGGSTSNTLVLNAVQAGDSGDYRLVASNTFGSVTSKVARVDVFSGSISQDLVAHLKFDDDLTDDSGNGNNGSQVGSTSFVPGQIGSSALRFSTAPDGSSYNYVSLGTPADLNFGMTNNFSVSFWTKFTTWTDDPPFISNKSWNSGGNQGWVIATAGDGRLQWNLAGPPGDRQDFDGSAGTLSDGNWHHVAVTFNRSGNTISYIDGIPVDASPINASDNNVDTPAGLATNIGQDGTGQYTDNGSAGFTDGTVDDVGIWSRILTPKEVSAIYSAGLTGDDLSQAMVGAGAVSPTIATQPQSKSATEGFPASLSVTANGTPPLSYQWKFNGTDISGATNSTFSIASVQSSDAGSYTVLISNAGGSVTSDPATLTVNPPPPVVVTGQWDFDSGDLTATVGSDLEYRGDTASGTTFTDMDINGQTAHVMAFPATTPEQGYIMPHGAQPNGDGSFVNRYTLIMDIMFPTDSASSWRSLFQTSTGNANDGDFFINPSGGIGISSEYDGQIMGDVWYRIALVVNLNDGTVGKFIDGNLVALQDLGSGVDGRWSLDPTALLFADESNETAPGFVNSIQFWNGVVSDSAIAALGGATAAGIPSPSMPSGLQISGITATGSVVQLTWSGGTAPYLVQMKTSLNESNWLNIVTTSNTSVTIPKVGDSAFFRVGDNAQTSVTMLTATLNGANERPTPVDTPATGTAVLGLEGTTLYYAMHYSGLSGAATAGHIHGPADADTPAGVLYPIPGVAGTSATLSGTLSVSSDNVTNLLNSMTYLNVHTPDHGGGEIRGQITP